MISPAQITVDVSGLPALAQQAVVSIDAALLTWQIDETEKYYVVTWANVSGGWSQAKEDGMVRLLDAYAVLGWNTRVVVKNHTTLKAAFQR